MRSTWEEVVYELSIGTKIGDIEWPWTAKWPLFCVIFTEFGSFQRAFTITMSSSKRLQEDPATPTV